MLLESELLDSLLPIVLVDFELIFEGKRCLLEVKNFQYFHESKN